VLYWLSSGKSQNVEELAASTGHHRTTVSRWLSIYRKVGMTSLLNIKKSSGRSRKIDREIEKCLVEELKDPEGFISYGEVQQWLKLMWDVEMSYTPHSAPQLSHGVRVGFRPRVVARRTKKLKYKCLNNRPSRHQ